MNNKFLNLKWCAVVLFLLLAIVPQAKAGWELCTSTADFSANNYYMFVGNVVNTNQYYYVKASSTNRDAGAWSTASDTCTAYNTTPTSITFKQGAWKLIATSTTGQWKLQSNLSSSVYLYISSNNGNKLAAGASGTASSYWTITKKSDANQFKIQYNANGSRQLATYASSPYGIRTYTGNNYVTVYKWQECDKAVGVTKGSESGGTITSISSASVATCNATASTRQVTITVTPNDCYDAPSTLTWTKSSGTVSASKQSGPTDNGDGTFSYVYQFAQNDNGAGTFGVTCTAKAAGKTVNFDAGPGVSTETSLTETCSGSGVTLPAVTASGVCKGWTTFAGWATAPVTDSTTTSGVTLYAAGDNFVPASNGQTLYAVYSKSKSGGTTTESYGWETGDATTNWEFDGVTANDGYHKTGSKAGKIARGSAGYSKVTFKNKVKVTSFSFQFMRQTTNNNYNVYIETSTDKSSWSAVETYAMSSFTDAETWYAKDHTFDGKTELYVRFNCYTTSAIRWVDDISITYSGGSTTYYCSDPNCCTPLGTINGSISLTQGGNSVTISGWSDVANVGTYTVRMYKKNGASWDLVSGSTSGGSAGTQGTRTGITSGSKSVTYTGLVVESEYKFTVQAIAGSASYCDGDETAVTEINSTDVSSTPFKFRYSICIDNGSGSDWTHHYIEPTENANEGTVTINLPAHVDSYQFKIYGGFSGNWGQTGTGKIPAATKWTLNGSNQVKLNTGAGGDYVFKVDYSGTTNPGVTVTFPSANQASGYKIYFDKSIIDGWGNTLKYRIGNNTDNQNQNFTLVTGTDNFYVTTTPSYNSMDAWQIANNTAWTPGDHDAAHGIYNYHHGDAYDITKATVYFDYVVDGDITMVPSSKKNTENGCDFWYTNKTDGMLTHTATITAPSNGTINLAYTNTSGTSCPTNTSTVSSLAHRTILTATATPATGYQLSTFTVTPSGESAQNLSSGDNHILAKDATFAATFAAKTYAISLDRNGGTTGATEVTMTYNSSSFTGWSAPSRTGYTFDGYYTSETDDNGSGTLVINTSGVLQANVDGYTGANGIWTKDATCTLYAKWTANTTTVTLTAGTGTNGSASIDYDATSYTSFSAAVRVGYTCTGYWTNTGGTGTKILNANGSFAASTISGYVTSDKWSYTTASTLTLYAGWTNTYAGYAFDLLEDVRDISAGSKIILIGTNAAGDTYKAMTTAQGDNNRGSVAAGSGEFVMSNSNKTATLGASTSVQVITLEDLATPADNTYQFNVENGYLYAAGTTNARLKTQTPNSAYGHWLVAVDANTKKATMTGQGGNSYNKIYYNNSSSIFAGYSNAQQPTYIYFSETRTKYTITWDKNGHGTAPTYPTNAARVTMPDISVTGYTNTGWKADKAVTNVSSGATISAGTLISNDTRVQLSANTTFTAQWSTDVYTISATLTNITASSAFPSTFTYTGATTTDLNRTLSVGSAYVLPTDLTVTMGGNPCTNGTEYTYDSGTGAFTFNVVITGNIVITGTALNKYTITLNPGNGSLTAGGGWSADGDNLVQVVVEGNNVTLPTPTPGCAGWSFKGWKLGSAANNQSSFTPDKTDGATFAPNATSTYYAVYRASTASGNNYSKIENEGEFVSGDYAIVAKWTTTYKAMGNSISSSHMTEATAAENSWTNSDVDYIWNIIKMGDKVGFYNDDESKFLTIVDGAWVLATEVQWYTYSFNSTTKAWTFTSPSGKQIGYDSWFNVLSAQNNAIYLYKRNTESGNYFTSPDCSSLTVTGVSDPVGAATVEISATTAHEGDKIWAYYTINRGYSFNHWDKSGTGATLSSTSTRLTRLTVGSTNASVTAVCDALTSYTLNYHDGDGNHTMTVYEGEKILEMLPEPSESCDDESTSFVGWSTTEIRTKTDVEPTFVSSSAVINSTTAASTYYAVYAKATGGSGNETLSCTAGTIVNNTMTFNTTNFTFVHKKNDSGASMSSQSPWRVYEKNTVEISGSLTITGLDIVHSETYYGNLSSSAGTLTLASSSGGTTTVRDINSTSVTILNASGAAQSRWSSIKVYYTSLSYSKYITTCCDAPTITISGTGKTVTDGKISFPVLREDLGGASSTTWAELPITISSNSSGAITIINGSMPEGGGNIDNAAKTAWKLSEWESRAESGGTITGTDHATFTNPSSGNYLFKVKTTTGYTGQGTYRIGITQAADATYCEAVVWMWVDVTLRDKFVDAVNGNAEINKDGHGAQLKTPAESDMDADLNDDCNSTTRRLIGWIKETDLQTMYGSPGETEYLEDAASYNASKVVAPYADFTASGCTWYAVWGVDSTPEP